MKHAGGDRASHTATGASIGNAEFLLVDPRHPDAAFLQRELDLDRKGEWFLIPKSLIAVAIVAVLVLVRQMYFA